MRKPKHNRSEEQEWRVPANITISQAKQGEIEVPQPTTDTPAAESFPSTLPNATQDNGDDVGETGHGGQIRQTAN